MRPKIACNYMPSHIKKAREILESVFTVDYVHWQRDDVVKHIEPYDAFISSLVVVDEKTYKAAKQLKVLATPSTGTDHLDIKGAENRGIAVLSLKYETDFLRSVTSTAEQALGLLLSAVRMIPASFDAVKRGEWNSSNFRGHSLYQKTLGILGYGRLGTMMARYGNALGMHVIAADPYKTIAEPYVRQVKFKELLQQSDIISIHVHLDDTTRNLLNRSAFESMKDSVVIINTSRGAIIDEQVLLEMLESGKVSAAGLDVLTCELFDSVETNPLVIYAKSHANLVITPHIGGVTYESQELAYGKIASMIRDWFRKNYFV